MTLPRFAQSPRDAGFVQDPYPAYAELRGLGPLVRWEELDLIVAPRHAEVSALLRDRRFGRENPFPRPVPAHLEPFYAVDRLSMLEREPPEHTRLRGLVLRAFTSRRIAALGPEIAVLSHELIDRLRDGDDLISRFCERLPVIVICRLLGVPEEKAGDLLAWSHAMVAMYQVRRDAEVERRAVEATQAFSAYLRGYIERRRAEPRDDLISHLIAAEADGDRLSPDELVATCILLLNAGHEATVHALGNGVRTLMTEGLWRPHDPDKLTEEILRHDPPLHLFTRYAMEEVEVAGHRFAKGEQVGLLLASANRDAEVFQGPDRFDPGRDAKAQVSFGAGLHFCVGAPLARLEMATALPILIERLPELALAASPTFADRWHFRGLEALPVHL